MTDKERANAARTLVKAAHAGVVSQSYADRLCEGSIWGEGLMDEVHTTRVRDAVELCENGLHSNFILNYRSNLTRQVAAARLDGRLTLEEADHLLERIGSANTYANLEGIGMSFGLHDKGRLRSIADGFMETGPVSAIVIAVVGVMAIILLGVFITLGEHSGMSRPHMIHTTPLELAATLGGSLLAAWATYGMFLNAWRWFKVDAGRSTVSFADMRRQHSFLRRATRILGVPTALVAIGSLAWFGTYLWAAIR
jgi:hypothetical protein